MIARVIVALALGVSACAPSPDGDDGAATRPTIVRVDDRANVLSPTDEQVIDAELASIERRNGDQVAVRTVTSLGGRRIEDVSLGIARAAGLGQKGRDNGALILLAPVDRKVRIETGRGLAGVITDAEAGRIVAKMLVRFRGGDYGGGMRLGVAEIDRELGEDLRRPVLLRKDEPWPV